MSPHFSIFFNRIKTKLVRINAITFSFQRNIVITVHRQTNNKQSRKMFRLCCYLTNFWNILALLLYTILISAVLIRIFNVGQRIEIRLYSLGLFIIYMRFFHSLMVLKYFGLKLIMIGKMVC